MAPDDTDTARCAPRWQAGGVSAAARPATTWAWPFAARLGLRRTTAGWLLAVAGPWALTWALLQQRDVLGLPTDLMLFFTLVVGTAIVGGLFPSLVCALLSSSLLNYFFTRPTGGLTIADPENALALVVFALVAVAVAWVVDLAERRSVQAREAQAEATVLSELSRTVLAGQDTPADLAAVLARHFGTQDVVLLTDDEPTGAEGADGQVPDQADGVVRAGGVRVVLPGRRLTTRDRRVVGAFVAQAALVLDRRRLRAAAERARQLEQVDALRTALLTAVSHDLRTPLASVRAAVDALSADGGVLSTQDRATLVEVGAAATGRLERIVDNLLDLSRVQMGAVTARVAPVSLDEVVPPAVEGLAEGSVVLDLPESLPLASTDAGLLERVVANIVANAVRLSPPGAPVLVVGRARGDRLEIRVVDRGPGVPAADRERMFGAFERIGPAGPRGVHLAGGMGLGLAVARGLADAVGAVLSVEDTPGGGLTMVVSVPRADAAGEGP